MSDQATTAHDQCCPCCGQLLPPIGTASPAVGERIRQARERRHLNQTDLGQRMARKRTHAAVSELEAGKVRFRLDDLTDLAALLNVPLLWLIDGSWPQETNAAPEVKRDFGQGLPPPGPSSSIVTTPNVLPFGLDEDGE